MGSNSKGHRPERGRARRVVTSPAQRHRRTTHGSLGGRRPRFRTGAGESQERLQAVVTSAPIVLFALDPSGVFTLSEGKGLEALGLRPGEAVGRSVFELLPAVSPVVAHVRRALAGETFVAEAEMGSLVFETRYLPVRMPGGEVGGIIGVSTDITERRRAQEARDRLIEILEATTDLVGIADTNGQAVYYNTAGRRMLGLADRGELGHLRIFEHQPPWAVDLVLNEGVPVALRDGVWSGETALVGADGREIPVSQVIIAHRRPDGAVEYCSTIARDISERKRIEGALNAKTGQLREEAEVAATLARVGKELISSLQTPAIVRRLCELTCEALGCDCSHSFIWQREEAVYIPVASHGDSDERWETIRAMRVPASVAAGLLGRLEHDDVTEVVFDDTQEASINALARQFGVTFGICMALRRGGEIFAIQTAGYRGRPGIFNVRQERIARGIAQIGSLALDNARLVDELERASRLKSDFVATMSHELRTPLNAIMGYNDLLRAGEFGPLTVEQGEIARRVDKCARELLDLINATLDVSRLEAGRLPLDLRETHVPALIGEIDIETRELQDKLDVDFVWNVPDAPPTLFTDPTKLKVVLKNLIGNAVKFTHEGTVSVDVVPCDGGMEFRVSDTGIGIDKQSVAIIFEPFRQAESAPNRRYGGVGLGLYIVRRLLDMLGGTITVESEIGRGSQFRVWVPLSAKPPARRKRP